MALGRHKGAEAVAERWLEVDASMTGTLAFKDPVNLQINGQFEGTLNIKGNLSIGQRAEVKATITGDAMTIAGVVTGNIIATQRVELLSSARVTGKVSTPRMVMHDGAVLEGTLDMGGAAGESSWMTVEDLARFLEVEAGTIVQWAKTGRLPAKQEGEQWKFNRAKIDEWLAQEKVKS